MAISEVPGQGSQLDRIETSIDDLRSINTQILDYLNARTTEKHIERTATKPLSLMDAVKTRLSGQL